MAELWAFQSTEYGSGISDSAYVTTWYDQSGSGNDATQSTAAAQPLLILAGVTELDNGKPAMVFDGVDDKLHSSTFRVEQPATGFTVSSATTQGRIWSGDDLERMIMYYSTSLDRRIFAGAAITGGNATADTQELMVGLFDSTSSELWSNGTSLVSGDTGTQACDQIWIGGDEFGAAGVKKIQEVIIYPSDQSSNRTGIEGNINDHYGIY